MSNKYSKFCIWSSAGETKEVYAQASQGEVYLESVNTDTESWLDIDNVLLFDTEHQALVYDMTHQLDGIVYNVGEFVKEHTQFHK